MNHFTTNDQAILTHKIECWATKKTRNKKNVLLLLHNSLPATSTKFKKTHFDPYRFSTKYATWQIFLKTWTHNFTAWKPHYRKLIRNFMKNCILSHSSTIKKTTKIFTQQTKPNNFCTTEHFITDHWKQHYTTTNLTPKRLIIEKHTTPHQKFTSPNTQHHITLDSGKLHCTTKKLD